MLLVDRDSQTGTSTYTVCNDAGLCLIRTSDSKIANFVHRHSLGISSHLRLLVGGDPGTTGEHPIWEHVRRWHR